MKSFKWLLMSWLKERYVCTDLLWLCTKRQFSGDQERELETLSRMTNRPAVDDEFSSFSDFFFSVVQNRMKKRILEKRPNHKSSAVGVNCRHMTHRTKRETKGQTSQVIDMQLCRLSVTWYRIGCRKRTLIFRSFISGIWRFGFHWFRADSNVYDWQKSWNCFFRHPFLWDHLAAMSYSLFRG